MYIFGSECTLTLVRNAELTPIPYTLETIREEKEETPLDPLVGYILPLVHVPCGTGDPKILGCTVTRVCNTSLIPLSALLVNGHTQPFMLYLNRIVEKRIYRNLLLTGWEARADRDEAAYIRLDMEGREAAEWDYKTPDVPWEQNTTLHFHDGDIVLDGNASNNIYRFSLTRLYNGAISTLLQIHYPLKDGDTLNNIRQFTTGTLTLGNKLRFTVSDLILLSFHANTDNAEEILVVRRFRVDGACVIEVCNDEGEWVDPE